jgi:hypothetical protein
MSNRLQKRVDTEKLLQWAFRDELPKKEFGGWTGSAGMSPMFRLADLGTRVDDWSDEPGFPLALGAPHPDALVVEAAVLALEDVGVNWPGSKPLLMDELGGLLSDDDPTLSALVIGTVGLVALHARMGTRPRWDYEPLPEPIVGRNGKPVVQYVGEGGQLVEGRKARHYGEGARCPLMWFPAPREAAYARLEWTIWCESVEQLGRDLAGKLEDHIAIAPQLPRAPWR